MKRNGTNRDRKNIETEINYGLSVLSDFDSMTLQEESKHYSQLKNTKRINVTDLDEPCWVVFPDCYDCNPNKRVMMLKTTFREIYSENLKRF